MKILVRTARSILNEYRDRVLYPPRVKGKPKIFCIGMNKTGTTSFKKAFEDLGYIVGRQRKAEYLFPKYKSGNFDAIIKYCRSAQVFQDFPFTYPETYKYLDKAFPDAKFVLTIRDSPEQWYNSMEKFYSKMFGEEDTPTKENLKTAKHVWKGWAWEVWEFSRKTYNLPEDGNIKGAVIKSYLEHNKAVEDYFKDRPDKLLIINVAEQGSYQKLMEFLDRNSPYSEFPWVNKTKNITVK